MMQYPAQRVQVSDNPLYCSSFDIPQVVFQNPPDYFLSLNYAGFFVINCFYF